MSSRIVGIASQIMVMAIIVSIGLLFLGIAALVVIHVCVVGRALRRGLRAVASGGGHSGRGLSPQELEMLPCYDFKEGDDRGGGDCAVCLDPLQNGDKCRLLPACNHSFHAQCVDSWLLKSAICPICRSEAGPGKGKAPSGSGQSQLSEDVRLELLENPSVVVGIHLISCPSAVQASSSV